VSKWFFTPSAVLATAKRQMPDWFAMSPATSYGTTVFGGAYGYGTVFKLAATGHESVKYSFNGAANGSEPYGGLYRDAEGNLYGTTSQGGVYNYGIVFKVTALGKHVVLHSFRGGVYGAYPYAV
jgi:uncharacterized repeat protein (TIGR03803 family)